MPKTNWEQFWKLYKRLSPELQDALFAEETGNAISETCQENGISKEMGEVVDFTGQVLVGLLPPDEFETALKQEAKLKPQTAKKVAMKIHRFVFYPVKSAMEELYGKISAAPFVSAPAKPMEEKELNVVKPEPEEEQPDAKGPDVYREPTS